jgi:dihydropteroate synthase
MGIVNVTPDSFSDGGRYVAIEAAVDHGRQLVEQGADLLDVGGESTRPGAAPVSLADELRRVVPVVERLAASCEVPISIDTSKAAVAREALAAGAAIVNDVSGLRVDPGMPAVCAGSNCGVICMHMLGTPQTMQIDPRYDDVVQTVCDFLNERLQTLERSGVARERVAVDPGIGFGKTAEHNLQLLAHVSRLRALGRPVLIGHSRKRFLQKLLGRPLDERLSGTIGVAIAAAMQHADIIRVHDVGPVKDALVAWSAVASLVPRDSSAAGVPHSRANAGPGRSA